MGGAERGPALIPSLSREALLAASEDRAEAVRRGARANVATTVAALLLAAIPIAQHDRRASMAIVLGAWLVFETATIAFHRLGPAHVAYRALATLDELTQLSAVLALVYLHGSAATPLWLFAFARAFAWQARAPVHMRTARLALYVTHGALALALLAAGRFADAAFTGLALLASSLAHVTSVRTVVRTAHLRAERDRLACTLRDTSLQKSRERIAREIHDGVGADVTALVLRLRREARHGGSPGAGALAERAQGILDELRGVVWSLRNEQGTLAELGKLIDATCRRLVGTGTYVRETPAEDGRVAIGPRAALEALEGARTLVEAAVACPGASHVALTLSAKDALVIAVAHDGEEAPDDARALRIALSSNDGP